MSEIQPITTMEKEIHIKKAWETKFTSTTSTEMSDSIYKTPIQNQRFLIE